MDRTHRCILTNICLVYKDDEILVIDRKKKDWPGLTLPGGHVEKKENLIESVIREVKEITENKKLPNVKMNPKKCSKCGYENFCLKG